MGESLAVAIGGVLTDLSARWSELAFDRMKGLWDPDEPAPVYVAEELRHPLVGWEAFDEYWTRLSGRLRHVRYEISELHAWAVGDELAAVVFVIAWTLHPVELTEPSRGESRATALLRRTAQGWRFIHWMEAPIHRAATDDDLVGRPGD